MTLAAVVNRLVSVGARVGMREDGKLRCVAGVDGASQLPDDLKHGIVEHRRELAALVANGAQHAAWAIPPWVPLRPLLNLRLARLTVIRRDLSSTERAAYEERRADIRRVEMVPDWYATIGALEDVLAERAGALMTPIRENDAVGAGTGDAGTATKHGKGQLFPCTNCGQWLFPARRVCWDCAQRAADAAGRIA